MIGPVAKGLFKIQSETLLTQLLVYKAMDVLMCSFTRSQSLWIVDEGKKPPDYITRLHSLNQYACSCSYGTCSAKGTTAAMLGTIIVALDVHHHSVLVCFYSSV